MLGLGESSSRDGIVQKSFRFQDDLLLASRGRLARYGLVERFRSVRRFDLANGVYRLGQETNGRLSIFLGFPKDGGLEGLDGLRRLRLARRESDR